MIKDYLYKVATDRNKGIVSGIVKLLLLILSFIYGLIVRSIMSFSLLSPNRIASKVVSVGNITWGGTGKTPLVEFIARYLRQIGHKSAILTRGYKRRSFAILPAEKQMHEIMGDEPYMLKVNLKDIPVIVNTNRLQGAEKAIAEYGVDTVILDDGLQQWKIKKDLEIVAIDSLAAFGNRHMIPRGILRQPLSSLKRADIFVLTNTNVDANIQSIKDELYRINRQAIVVEARYHPVGFYKIDSGRELLPPGILKGKKVALVCGIGNPDSFRNSISQLGVNIGLSFEFPDHHDYSLKELDGIMRKSRGMNIEALVTTEKDAVKLAGLTSTNYNSMPINQRLSVFVLRIELQITKNEQELYNRLLGLYSL